MSYKLRSVQFTEGRTDFEYYISCPSLRTHAQPIRVEFLSLLLLLNWKCGHVNVAPCRMAATLHQHGHTHGGGGSHSHGGGVLSGTETAESAQSSAPSTPNHRHDVASDHGHSHGAEEKENINVRAAFIHVIGDFVQSLGVFIAALVIYFKVSGGQPQLTRRLLSIRWLRARRLQLRKSWLVKIA